MLVTANTQFDKMSFPKPNKKATTQKTIVEEKYTS